MNLFQEIPLTKDFMDEHLECFSWLTGCFSFQITVHQAEIGSNPLIPVTVTPQF